MDRTLTVFNLKCTPLLAGPGAIVATMLFVQRTNSVGDAVAFGIAIVAVVTVLWLAMRFSGVLHDSGVELLSSLTLKGRSAWTRG